MSVLADAVMDQLREQVPATSIPPTAEEYQNLCIEAQRVRPWAAGNLNEQIEKAAGAVVKAWVFLQKKEANA